MGEKNGRNSSSTCNNKMINKTAFFRGNKFLPQLFHLARWPLRLRLPFLFRWCCWFPYAFLASNWPFDGALGQLEPPQIPSDYPEPRIFLLPNHLQQMDLMGNAAVAQMLRDGRNPYEGKGEKSSTEMNLINKIFFGMKTGTVSTK